MLKRLVLDLKGGRDDERSIFAGTVEGNSTIDLIVNVPTDNFSIAEFLLSVNNMSLRSLNLSSFQIIQFYRISAGDWDQV